MVQSDPECCSKGIPTHLHRNGRPEIPSFDKGELLYRRHREVDAELVECIKFESKQSSSNRSKFSNPIDVLLNCETGASYENWGVLSFPATIFEGESWIAKDTAEFTITVIHSPYQCNYSHSDFRIQANGAEVSKIKPPSIKMKIREYLKGFLESKILPANS